jgi:hypothetical protein
LNCYCTNSSNARMFLRKLAITKGVSPQSVQLSISSRI